MDVQLPDRPQVLVSGTKRVAHAASQDEQPRKKARALLQDEDTSDEDSGASGDSGGVAVNGHDDSLPKFTGFSINEDFARRFEHNKKRAELHRCEWGLGSVRHLHADKSSGREIWYFWHIYEDEFRVTARRAWELSNGLIDRFRKRRR